jgi:hypothetical protein
MMLRPTLVLDFAGSPGVLDPRVAFARASPGSYSDQSGLLKYRPAGAPRFMFSSDDGSSLGLISETPSTNRILWSEDFTNAAWTKSACTVAANSQAAPDGNLTGDAITATDITASVVQTVTGLTAGQCLIFSVFAKATSNTYISLSLADGANTVTCWFNLISGTVGSFRTSVGSTVVFAAASMRPWFGNWWRCALVVTTTSTTTVAASIAPCYADLASPVAGNMALLWGAMLSMEGPSAASASLTSYLATTTVAVARAGETCSIPYANIDPSAFGWTNGGTFFLEFAVPAGVAASSAMLCGFSTGSDYIMMGFNLVPGSAQLSVQANIVAGGITRLSVADTAPYAPDVPTKAAMRYGPGMTLDVSINGRTPVRSVTTTFAVPAQPPTALLFNSIAGTFAASAPVVTRRFAHYARQVSLAQLQAITV